MPRLLLHLFCKICPFRKSIDSFRYRSLAFACFFLIIFQAPVCFAQKGNVLEGSAIQTISPADGSAVVAKRPVIKATFKSPVKQKSVLILIDGVDVTPLSKVTATQVIYHPIMALGAGSHSVDLTATDEKGASLSRKWSFNLKHTPVLEEAYLKGNVHAKYERKTTRVQGVRLDPEIKVEGNLNVGGGIAYRQTKLSFDSNVRYFDYLHNEVEALDLLEEGLHLGDYIIIGEHSGELFQIRAELGDIQVTETPYTVDGLSRRGGKFKANFKGTELSLFSVKSEETLYFDGGLGIGLQPGDHVAGASLSQSFFDGTLKFKATYLTGEDRTIDPNALSTPDDQREEEEDSTYAISGLEAEREGDAASFLVACSLFDGKLNLDGEIVYSDFDPDISDEFEDYDDGAGEAKVHGEWGWFSYEALYKYVGPDFYTLGSPGLPEDRQEANVSLGATFEQHSLSLALSRLNDNVEGDRLMPRMVDWEGSAEYTFSYFAFLPMTVSYQKSMQYSTQEPEDYLPSRLHVDTVTGIISFVQGSFYLNAVASYSFSDDRTDQDQDTYTTNYSLAGSYTLAGYLSISPSVSLTQSKDMPTDVRTDTIVGSLDIRSSFFDQFVTLDTGGSYTITKDTDETVDIRTLSLNSRLSLNFERFLWRLVKPTVSLEAKYDNTLDYILSENNIDEFTLLLVFELAAPFYL